jgi:hypothetical protein
MCRGLVLRCRCELPVHRQMRQRRLYLGSTQIPGVTLVVEENVPSGPVDILGLRSYAVVLEADAIWKLIEEPRFRRCVLRAIRCVHV